VNDSSALLYQLSVLGDDNPKLKETTYALLMLYRYKLHREWMYFEVSPQLSFPRTDDQDEWFTIVPSGNAVWHKAIKGFIFRWILAGMRC